MSLAGSVASQLPDNFLPPNWGDKAFDGTSIRRERDAATNKAISGAMNTVRRWRAGRGFAITSDSEMKACKQSGLVVNDDAGHAFLRLPSGDHVLSDHTKEIRESTKRPRISFVAIASSRIGETIGKWEKEGLKMSDLKKTGSAIVSTLTGAQNVVVACIPYDLIYLTVRLSASSTTEADNTLLTITDLIQDYVAKFKRAALLRALAPWSTLKHDRFVPDETPALNLQKNFIQSLRLPSKDDDETAGTSGVIPETKDLPPSSDEDTDMETDGEKDDDIETGDGNVYTHEDGTPFTQEEIDEVKTQQEKLLEEARRKKEEEEKRREETRKANVEREKERMRKEQDRKRKEEESRAGGSGTGERRGRKRTHKSAREGEDERQDSSREGSGPSLPRREARGPPTFKPRKSRDTASRAVKKPLTIYKDPDTAYLDYRAAYKGARDWKSDQGTEKPDVAYALTCYIVSCIFFFTGGNIDIMNASRTNSLDPDFANADAESAFMKATESQRDNMHQYLGFMAMLAVAKPPSKDNAQYVLNRYTAALRAANADVEFKETPSQYFDIFPEHLYDVLAPIGKYITAESVLEFVRDAATYVGRGDITGGKVFDELMKQVMLIYRKARMVRLIEMENWCKVFNTQAHTTVMVAEEIVAFMMKVKRLRDAHQENYEYLALIEPKALDGLVAGNYPHLAYCASTSALKQGRFTKSMKGGEYPLMMSKGVLRSRLKIPLGGDATLSDELLDKLFAVGISAPGLLSGRSRGGEHESERKRPRFDDDVSSTFSD